MHFDPDNLWLSYRHRSPGGATLSQHVASGKVPTPYNDPAHAPPNVGAKHFGAHLEHGRGT